MAKIRLVLLFFSGLFVLIVTRLFYFQIISPISSVNNAYLKYKKIGAQRGKIYDRSSQPLALNQTKHLLYLEPKKMREKNQLIEKLDEVLHIGEATLEARIDESKQWIAITGGITKENKEKIQKLRFPEVGFEDQFQRYYPEASLAAHLLGFVGKNKENEDIGYFGLEGYYDKDLAGLPGLIKTERDLLGRAILLGNQDKIEPENGRDLILTIDKSVQEIVKGKLKAGLEKYKAREGCVIVADPFTMEIFSLVCLPDFDPEKYYESSEKIFANPAISSVYEPGSTFKPLVMAAALEEKKLKPTDLYNEKGPVSISGHQIRTWNSKYEGKISMTRILEKSSNVGMVYVGEKLGEKKLLSYIKDYGFGDYTGIDLQGETGNTLKSEDAWYPIDYATATFGQGIAVTPIQMITAFASLINGGEVLEPHMVKKIIYSENAKEVNPRLKRRAVSEKTSNTIKKMLLSTVEHGEYKWIRPEGYKIGGKTGTAQIAVQGKYDPSKTIASFVGFAPVDKPRFITLVVLKEPKTSPYGSETAAPLFFEIAKDLLVYYNIAPE